MGAEWMLVLCLRRRVNFFYKHAVKHLETGRCGPVAQSWERVHAVSVWLGE